MFVLANQAFYYPGKGAKMFGMLLLAEVGYADWALYYAKDLGRNQVQLWQPLLTVSSDE